MAKPRTQTSRTRAKAKSYCTKKRRMAAEKQLKQLGPKHSSLSPALTPAEQTKTKSRRGITSRSPTLKVMCFQNEAEGLLDEVTGRKRKTSSMHILNKKRVSKWEMDELFGDIE